MPTETCPRMSPVSSSTTVRQLATAFRAARVGQHLRPYFGESHGASGTIQEGLAQLGLEPADLGANTRLGDVELCGRPREIGLFGNGHKVLQLSEFHN